MQTTRSIENDPAVLGVAGGARRGTTDLPVASNDDESLLQEPLASASGDFDFLVQFVQTAMPSSLQRYLGSSDIVQSVICRVHKSRDEFRGHSIEQFRAWVLRIARHRIIDGLRRFRLQTSKSTSPGCFQDQFCEIDSSASPLEGLVSHERAEKLLDALEALPSDIQRIVILRYSKEHTFYQIAAELRIPVTTCRRRWEQGCKLLGERLLEWVG
ncbi:MAG: sigma-70 family RNA polymerase sigma factor [Planctomycetaceae bacterium]|nr:sigma-70 family RNA polymerase sigma factor [Planctomycetaceae bacterium]